MSVEALEQNLRQTFRVIAADRPSGDVREIGGVSFASAGAAFQMFNAAFLAKRVTATPGELERRITMAVVHFRARRLDWSFWVCQGLLEKRLANRARKVFEHHGLHRAVELPGMVAERLLPPRRPLPALEVRRVADERTRLAFCDVGATCFHVPPLWFREIFLFEKVWRGNFAGYVGYRNGEPIATAATAVSAGAIGVYNVATLPAYRRQGFAEATMRHAIEQARRESGCERSTLQATDYGYTLYNNMGYRTVTSIAVYASEAAAG